MRIVLVKSSFYRQGTQLNREVESMAQGHIWAKWWSQNWNAVTLTTDGICLLWAPSLPRSPRSHKQVVAEPELAPSGHFAFSMLLWGDHDWPLPEQRWPRLIPLHWRLPLHPRFPPADIGESSFFVLPSQHRSLSFGSFLEFLLLQSWDFSTCFFGFLLIRSSGSKHPDTIIFMHAFHFVHLTHNIDASHCHANHYGWATRM